MIPPWVLPESPETIRWIDDATAVFAPAFGRGMTQRGSWGDPRWGLRRRYRGLRSDQLSAIRSFLNESRGQFNRILATPHAPLRGSFPATEVLSNYTFANGTTGWSGVGGGTPTLSVSDRALRVQETVGTNGSSIAVSNTAAATVTQYAPYIVRAFIRSGRNAFATYGVRLGTSQNSNDLAESLSATPGMAVASTVPLSTSVYATALAVTSSNIAGDFIEVPYLSLTRCIQVDHGPNLLLRSDEIDNASWTKTRCAIPNSQTAPDGTSTADTIQEDSTASNTHLISQGVTVSSAAADYAFSVALKASGRNWAAIEMHEGTGGVNCYFNLSTGAIGTPTTGTNWSNLRTFVVDLGSGWYQCTIVAKKTSSSTSIACRTYLATADATATYSGNGTSAIIGWRATLSQSSVPSRLRQTDANARGPGASTIQQTGAALYVRGLPASTSNILLPGDWVEVSSQLKQVTAALSSDAAGLGYLQFRPALGDGPADADPVIVGEPFGRFIYSGQTKELENQFGLYGDIEMQLEEVYA